MRLVDVMTPHDVEVPAHLAADAEVPVLFGLQRQGDVVVIPMQGGVGANYTSIPSEGIPVVRGEAGGNTHLLVGTGLYARLDEKANIGALLVEEGATAWLLHPEHGAQGIGAGTYLLRRQQEMADQIKLVSD